MLVDKILRRFTQIPGMRSLWSRFPIGPISTRVRYGISSRPPYAYGVFAAADLAKRLGLGGITAIELGVAGGRGLLALESIAMEVGFHLGIQISVFGFDSGKGMPTPIDYRDLPHVWDQGFYDMDQASLRARLKHAVLILGDVEDTIPAFLMTGGIPPIGFIAFDLDYYSSTKKAFRLFEGSTASRLPRVYCYFDDIMWPTIACHNEYVGELCAIREFNLQHEGKKICPISMLRYMQPHIAAWNEQMFVLHDFHHPHYCVNITPRTDANTQKLL